MQGGERKGGEVLVQEQFVPPLSYLFLALFRFEGFSHNSKEPTQLFSCEKGKGIATRFK